MTTTTDSAPTTEILNRTIHERRCPRCARTTAQHPVFGGGWFCYAGYHRVER